MRATRSDSAHTLASAADYWRNLIPGFTVTEEETHASIPVCRMTQSELRSASDTLYAQGYFQMDQALPESAAHHLAGLIARLVELNYPSVFAAIYDEFWKVLEHCDGIFRYMLGNDYKLLPNFSVIHRGEANAGAWAPKRARSHTVTLGENFFPLTLRLWIPLTASTITNGCRYILPANFDSSYPNDLLNFSDDNLQH